MPNPDPRHELASRPCDFCGVEGCPLAFTGHGYACEGCWPDTAPQGVVVLEAGPIDGLRPNQVPTREQVQAHYDARLRADAAPAAPDIDYWGLTDAPDPDDDDDDVAVLDQLATFELRIGELRGIVAGMGEAYLATLPELERRLISATRAHLAEYDRAKRGEGHDEGHL